ncbi:embryogenesis-like protein [Aristolochia californica]|uniref:embryogenesis-like protein n=1 Tax=Aristolochia californica TaxID=171875 RepID=UPI0035DC3D55
MPPTRPCFLCKFISSYPFRQPSKPVSSFLMENPVLQQKRTISGPLSLANLNVSSLSISKIRPFLFSSGSSLLTQFRDHATVKYFSTKLDAGRDHGKEIDEINLKFAEAREEIEMALESKETVYFNEEAECARDAAKTVLDMFDGLLAKLPEDEKAALQRSMGLKIEQLKAELKQLDD